MARGGGLLFFILYALLGLYFINFGIQFVKIPAAISGIEKWIIFVGGVLLIFGAFRFLGANRYNRAR
ncbi:MAG: hypothetical protein NTZ83_06635 [Candidatus Pacearchaeota archaeon]|nr:hypothetical protein [Candidatus Pacearchaeota archaeon]